MPIVLNYLIRRLATVHRLETMKLQLIAIAAFTMLTAAALPVETPASQQYPSPPGLNLVFLNGDGNGDGSGDSISHSSLNPDILNVSDPHISESMVYPANIHSWQKDFDQCCYSRAGLLALGSVRVPES